MPVHFYGYDHVSFELFLHKNLLPTENTLFTSKCVFLCVQSDILKRCCEITYYYLKSVLF